MNACVHTYTKQQTSSTRSRGPGWRMHGSVEDTKLSTNKQLSLSLGSGGLVVDAMAIGCLGADRRGERILALRPGLRK